MKISNLLRPVCNGLCGFVLFLSVVVLIKIISSVFGTTIRPLLDVSDLLLCTVGFVLYFLISVLNNFKKDTEDESIHSAVGREKI